MLEQVGLEGEHLLHPQRPLLVPRPRQPQRLVPGRELDRPGAGVPRQGDAEHLQHDALHVVLRLGLGQAERVDLHAVPEPRLLLVGDAVALREQLGPEPPERPHLAQLLDEPDAGVHEERDPLDHAAEVSRLDLAGVADGVEHREGGAQRVGQLLDRGRARLLQVVAAHVDRVPPRHLLDGVRDEVRRQPHRRRGREDVRPPGQVLLDDVVLGGAGQQLGRRPAGRHRRLAGRRLLLGHHLVEREQPHRRRVDRHRRVHRGQRDALEEPPHVAHVRDRHTDLAHLAAGQRVVGVVAGLGREVEGHRQPGLTLGQVQPVQGVGRGRGRVPRVRAHDPGPVPPAVPFALARHRTRVLARVRRPAPPPAPAGRRPARRAGPGAAG